MAEATASITSVPQKEKPKKSTYILIHRSLHEGYLRGDGNAQALFLYLICKAQRFETESGGKKYMPGDVIASIALLKDVTGFSKKVIFRCINKLEKGGSISTRRDHRGTYITICNYLQYQLDSNHHGTTEGPSKGTTSGTSEGPYYKKERTKEGKKEKKKEKEYLAALTPLQGELLKNWVVYSKDASKAKLVPNENQYAKAILDLERRFGLTDEKMTTVLDFVKNDVSFWRAQAFSLPGLLEKSKNGLPKIENILQAMARTDESLNGDEVRRKKQADELREWARQKFGDEA